jgi:hypothetical protein
LLLVGAGSAYQVFFSFSARQRQMIAHFESELAPEIERDVAAVFDDEPRFTRDRSPDPFDKSGGNVVAWTHSAQYTLRLANGKECGLEVHGTYDGSARLSRRYFRLLVRSERPDTRPPERTPATLRKLGFKKEFVEACTQTGVLAVSQLFFFNGYVWDLDFNSLGVELSANKGEGYYFDGYAR